MITVPGSGVGEHRPGHSLRLTETGFTTGNPAQMWFMKFPNGQIARPVAAVRQLPLSQLAMWKYH